MSKEREFGFVVQVNGAGYFCALIGGQSFVCQDMEDAVRHTANRARQMVMEIARMDKKIAHVVPYAAQQKATQ